MTRVILFSLLIALLVACAGQPTAPTPAPGGSPTPGHSPDPTPDPTPAATFDPDQVAHPTGATDVVLQMEVGGGFVPLEYFVTQMPQFTLYGDGTVIFRPSDEDGRGGPLDGLPRLLQGRLDEEGIQALLHFALGQGRLAAARDFYGQNACADCPTTIFRLNAVGLAKTVTIDALGMVDEVGPDAADRRGFAALAETLGTFEREARAGTLGEVTHYDPALYRVVLVEADWATEPPLDWPWRDLTIDDFPAPGEGWQRVALLARADVALLTEVPSGGVMGILVADDGQTWSVSLRPLLPDEIDDAG